MIRGLSPIPRGGGKPEGKEGGAVLPRSRHFARSRVFGFARKLFGAFLHPEIQQPPPVGSPKNHSPRRGPTILGGTFGARVRATSLPRSFPRQIMPLAAMRPARRANSGRAAAYFESSARHSPARHSPGRRLLRLHAPKEFPSCLRTPRTGFVRDQARDSVFEKECARSSTLRIIFLRVKARDSVFENCSACSDTLRRSALILLPICIKPGQRSRRIYSGTERERREAIFMSARTYSRPRP